MWGRRFVEVAAVASVFVILFGAGGACGYFEEDVTFGASLDGSTRARKARGVADSVVSQAVSFSEGRTDRAIVIGGPEQGSAGFETAGNLDPSEGTAAFWFNILDWMPKTFGPDQVFFISGDVALFQGQHTLMFYALDKNGNIACAQSYILADQFQRSLMKQGEWHWMAATWKPGEVALFVNGEKVGTAASPEYLTPFRFADKFFVGNYPRYQGTFAGRPMTSGLGEGTTAIDDLVIYKRALAPEEIRLLFKTLKNPETKVGALFTIQDYPAAQKVGAWAIVRTLPDYETKAKFLEIQFLDSSGNLIYCPDKVSIKDGSARVLFSTSNLAPAEYTVEMKILDEGRVAVASEKEAYKKLPVPDWVGNSIGKAEIVAPPFTPLKWEGNTLYAWGREYKYEKSLLPAQVVSQGIALLSSPIVIEYARKDASGNPVWRPLETSEIKAISVKENMINLEAEAQVEGFSAKAAEDLDFDGSLWVKFTLTPQGKPIEGLRLVARFRPEAATHFHLHHWFDCGTVSEMLKGQPSRDFPFRPMVWMGNTRVGLQFLFPSAENWTFSDKSRVATIPDPGWVASIEDTNLAGQQLPLKVSIRGGDIQNPEAVSLQVSLIEGPVRLENPVTIEFCLEAVPARPMQPFKYFFRTRWPDGHHAFPGSKDTRFGKLFPFGMFEFTNMSIGPGYIAHTETEPLTITNDEEREKIKMLLAQAEKAGITAQEYLSLYNCTEKSGLYGEEWALGWSGPGLVCPNSSYQDFFIANLKKFLDETGFRALYLDNPWPFPCRNHVHGCGYVGEDGQRYTEIPISAHHEMRKRIFLLMYEKYGEDFWVEENASGWRCAPVNAFSNVLLDGEVVFLLTKPELKMHPRAIPVLQTMSSPRVWGAAVKWFGYSYLPRSEDDPYVLGPNHRPFEIQAALLRLHGISSDFASGQHYGLIWRLFEAEDKFDMRGDVEFTPYWEAGDLVETYDENVKVSLYARPERVMVFVGNLGEKALDSARIKINAEKLGLRFRGHAAYDAWDPYHAERYRIREDGTIHFPMEAGSFRPLIIER